MVRKILLVIGLILLILVITNVGLITYGIKQGMGQLSIVWGARDFEEVFEDPEVADSVKSKLRLITDIVSFGVEEVALEDKGNYQTYFDQHARPLLFVVTAAQPFELTAYEWEFPVVGSMPYKGYFELEDAEKERKRLEESGYDAYIRTPGGWSTLGWFKDPVLSNMLERNEGDLANVILHELTHATIFVKDSVDYNENLASFIGDEATERYLKKRFGEGSEEWQVYQNENEDYDRYVDHILRGTGKLDSLYNKIQHEPVEIKKELKDEMILNIINSLDTISFHRPEDFKWDSKILPNNAYFMSFLRYQSRQDIFKEQLETDFNNNLESFVKYLTKKYE